MLKLAPTRSLTIAASAAFAVFAVFGTAENAKAAPQEYADGAARPQGVMSQDVNQGVMKQDVNQGVMKQDVNQGVMKQDVNQGLINQAVSQGMSQGMNQGMNQDLSLSQGLNQGQADGQAQGVSLLRKKKLGDISYRTMWRMQQRVAALLPRDATLISPVLRLSLKGMAQCERAEFQPESWAVAIVGKTLDRRVPMRRGGYFELPALPQAQSRSEDAIVMFNARERKNWFDVGWNVHVPPNGTLAYTQFGQALAELKRAQDDMPWWDIMAIPEKRAKFDAIRACFTSDQGKILVAGEPAGQKLSAHCTLLTFDPHHLHSDPAIAFVGGLEFVTLDNTDNYANDPISTM